jgi:hypothetical protein
LKRKSKQPHSEEYWQEIFDTIDMEYLPIQYMNKCIVSFSSGTVWEIDIKDSLSKQPVEDIETTLGELFEEYEDEIESLDFRMDMETIKKDLSKRVSRFIKLNK